MFCKTFFSSTYCVHLTVFFILNFWWCQQAEKGIPTSGPKLKSELKEEERKRKRLKSKVKKDKKDHKKHSEQQKDKSSHMEKCIDFSRGSTLESLKKPWDNVCTFTPLVALLYLMKIFYLSLNITLSECC